MEQKKTSKFISKNKEYFVLLGIVFVVLNIIFACTGTFPFGSKVCLVSDSDAQIGPYFTNLIKFLKGESSLFYSPYICGGMEIFTTIEYMLLSPFYVLCLLGGKAHCLQMFNFAFVFMCLFNAFVFVWFSKKYFKNLNLFTRTVIGILFVFSGYTLQAYSFLTWITYPALTLLLFDAFHGLVYDKKILRFTLLLIWYVITCFSVGVLSNFILVALFMLFVIFKVEKENKKEVSTRLFVSYIIAVAASIAVLFPQIFANMSTSRTTIAIDLYKVMKVFSFINFAMIFTDSALLLFAILEIIKIFKKEKCSNNFKFVICAISMLMFPYIFKVSLELLSGGVYSGFSMRYYYIFSVCLTLLAMKFFDSTMPENECETTGVFKMIYIMMFSIFAIAITIFEVLYFYEIGSYIKDAVKTQNSPFVFYSMIFVVFVILFVFVWFFNKRKVLSKKFLSFTIASILCISCTVNILAIPPQISTDKSYQYELMDALEEENLHGNIKYIGLSDKYNDIMTNKYADGVGAYTVFSSLLPNSTISSFRKLGYSGNMNYISAAQQNGLLTADILINNNYYFSDTEVSRPYLSLVKQTEHFYIYKNELVGSGAYLLNKDFEFNRDLSVFENYNNLGSSLGVSKDMFSEIHYDVEDCNDSFVNVVSVKKYSFTATEDGVIYINFNGRKLTKDEQKSYSYDNIYIIENGDGEYLDVAFVRAGETYTFTAFMMNRLSEKDDTIGEFLSLSAVQEFSDKLKENELELQKNKHGWTASGTSAEGKQAVILMNNLKGMEYSNSGNKIECNNKFLNFVAFDIDAGEVNIEATYKCPYLKWWVVIIALAAAIIVAVALVYHYTGFKHVQKFCHYAMLTVFWGILSIFYIISIFLTIFKIWV